MKINYRFGILFTLAVVIVCCSQIKDEEVLYFKYQGNKTFKIFDLVICVEDQYSTEINLMENGTPIKFQVTKSEFDQILKKVNKKLTTLKTKRISEEYQLSISKTLKRSKNTSFYKKTNSFYLRKYSRRRLKAM